MLQLFYKNKLMKKTLLITPNIPEAEILTKIKIKSTKDMIKAGKILIRLGAKNVLDQRWSFKIKRNERYFIK